MVRDAQSKGGFGLGLKFYIKRLRDGYVISQVKRIKLPAFKASPVVRNSVIFSGRVQKVGFRLEVYELAKRLKLTGWVKNRQNKTVEAEIQGKREKITFLINYMKSLKRASVQDVAIETMPTVDNESDFTLIKE